MTPRRIKTYSSQNGYIYQYFFLESRPLRRIWGAGGTAFLFNVSSDRKNYFEAEVAVEQKALEAWAQAHGRALTDTEKYAAAKMRLFQAFDETGGAHELRRICVDPANIESLLEPLRLDK